MQTMRKYGMPPYSIVVIHGGPGVSGEMAPVAKKLSGIFGVLEPLQTANTLAGQIDELKQSIEDNNARLPIALIGWSWGAWLSFLFAAQNPSYVKKLVLVGSPPFEDKYAAEIMQTRLSRLSKEDKEKVNSFARLINDAEDNEKDKILCEFGSLLSKADSYSPIRHDNDTVECRYDIYESVWKEAGQLRKTGRLLEYGKNITCPVVAIHGDYDPHPGEGVKVPLSKVLKDFRFILLSNCGHKPWYEKEARNRFYRYLRSSVKGLQ
jgi:pimeloyl-ACP methyl ester carboxylesterase